MASHDLPFVKMHGCANDYVVIDATQAAPEDPAQLARDVADRRRGVGSDGLLLALPAADADLRMRMFNPDGSEAEMCGNGLRCLVLFAVRRGLVDRATDLRIETGAGVLGASIVATSDGAAPTDLGPAADVAVDMGLPRLERSQIPMAGADGRVIDEALIVPGARVAVTAVSMGNPHAVVFVDDVVGAPVEVIGAAIENHEAFPQRTNVEFVQVISPTELRQRTWERGVGETLACGTGACAAAVAAALTGRTGHEVSVQLLGGTLHIRWDEAEGVRMTGPAIEVYEGRWPVAGD